MFGEIGDDTLKLLTQEDGKFANDVAVSTSLEFLAIDGKLAHLHMVLYILVWLPSMPYQIFLFAFQNRAYVPLSIYSWYSPSINILPYLELAEKAPRGWIDNLVTPLNVYKKLI